MKPRSWLRSPCVVCTERRPFIIVHGRTYCPACAVECRMFIERVRAAESASRLAV